MTQYQKRLINLFKTFVEKNLLPQLRKNDGSLAQWNKFSSLISVENLNYNDIQFYVDSLPNPTNLQPFEKRETLQLPKNREENNRQNLMDNQSTSFNANKTFGGQRAKMMMFPLKTDYDDFNNQKSDYTNKDGSLNNKEDNYKNKMINNGQSIISALQKLYKTFVQNQQKIQNSAGANNTQLQYTQEYKNYL